MIKNILNAGADFVKDLAIGNLKKLDLDKNGVFDVEQITALINRAHAAIQKCIAAINEPEVNAAMEEVVAVVVAIKALLKRLEGAINVEQVKSSIADLKGVLKDLGAYVKAIAVQPEAAKDE